jgi:hypothetical protein
MEKSKDLNYRKKTNWDWADSLIVFCLLGSALSFIQFLMFLLSL